jgi:hypothetical protein
VDETYCAGGYWGPRKEEPEVCARRLETLLSSLPRVAPSFVRWYKTAKSQKQSLSRPFTLNHEELTKFVLRCKDPVFDDLGFRACPKTQAIPMP